MLGEFDEVMSVVKRCHEALREGDTRVNSVLKIDDKPGLQPGDIASKVERVESELG